MPGSGTFDNDGILDPLPLPSIEDTLCRLRRSIAPFSTKEELAVFDAAIPSMITQLQKAQEVLQRRYDTKENWLGDWWDQFAYWRSRAPVVVNTNILCVRTIDLDDKWKAKPVASDPIIRAAICIKESQRFRRLMMEHNLRPESHQGRPLCMWQFRRYWSTRIAQPDVDAVVTVHPAEATTVTIMFGGAMFFVNVVDDDGTDLSFGEVVAALREGVKHVKPLPRSRCIGALTAGKREIAAKAFHLLTETNENNAALLKRIRESLTVISLDFDTVDTMDDGLRLACHGNPHNRWFDRANSQIVAGNGVTMYQGEHSPMDAVVSATTPVELMTKFSQRSIKNGAFEREPVRASFNPSQFVSYAPFEVPAAVELMIEQVLQDHDEFTKTCEIVGFRHKLNRAQLRSQRISADGLVQVALNVAFSRDRNSDEPVAGYESASTRLFRQGRTETIRSMTPELLDAIKAMNTTSVISNTTKRELVMRAIKVHARAAMEATTGHGIDRHLLGLRIASGVLQQPFPQLLDAQHVKRAQDFKLLTSQMVGTSFLGGFGHSLPEGYGCCYYLQPNEVHMTVACNSVAGKTSTARFSRLLGEALDDLSTLLVAPDSKL